MNEELQKKSNNTPETEPVKNPNFEPPSFQKHFQSPVSYPMVMTGGFAPIQAKLTIGKAGDKYEQEADNIARKVVKQINSPQVPPVQTSVEPAYATEELPSDDNSLAAKVQRQVIKDSQPPFQTIPQQNITPRNAEFHEKIRRQVVQDNVPQIQMMGLEGGTATPDFEKSLNSTRGGGTPLDSSFREKVEPLMGADFSKVKVHTDTKADNLSRSINAQAFTSGNDIYFAQGKFNTSSPGGQELVTHELTHNMQQTGSGTGVQSKSVQRIEDGNVNSQTSGLVKSTLHSQESVIQRQKLESDDEVDNMAKIYLQKKIEAANEKKTQPLNFASYNRKKMFREDKADKWLYEQIKNGAIDYEDKQKILVHYWEHYRNDFLAIQKGKKLVDSMDVNVDYDDGGPQMQESVLAEIPQSSTDEETNRLFQELASPVIDETKQEAQNTKAYFSKGGEFQQMRYADKPLPETPEEKQYRENLEKFNELTEVKIEEVEVPEAKFKSQDILALVSMSSSFKGMTSQKKGRGPTLKAIDNQIAEFDQKMAELNEIEDEVQKLTTDKILKQDDSNNEELENSIGIKKNQILLLFPLVRQSFLKILPSVDDWLNKHWHEQNQVYARGKNKDESTPAALRYKAIKEFKKETLPKCEKTLRKMGDETKEKYQPQKVKQVENQQMLLDIPQEQSSTNFRHGMSMDTGMDWLAPLTSIPEPTVNIKELVTLKDWKNRTTKGGKKRRGSTLKSIDSKINEFEILMMGLKPAVIEELDNIDLDNANQEKLKEELDKIDNTLEIINNGLEILEQIVGDSGLILTWLDNHKGDEGETINNRSKQLSPVGHRYREIKDYKNHIQQTVRPKFDTFSNKLSATKVDLHWKLLTVDQPQEHQESSQQLELQQESVPDTKPRAKTMVVSKPQKKNNDEQPKEFNLSLRDLKIATDPRLTPAKFQDITFDSYITGRGKTLKKIEGLLAKYNQLELTDTTQIDEAINLIYQVYGRVDSWLKNHYKINRAKRYPAMEKYRTFLLDKVIPALFDIKMSYQRFGIIVVDKVDPTTRVKNIKTAFEGEPHSFFEFYAKVIDQVCPNVGDKAKLDILVKFPVLPSFMAAGAGQAYISFRFMTQTERKKGGEGGKGLKKPGELALRNELYLGAGANLFSNILDARIEGGLYTEVLGDNSKEAANLMSYAIYKDLGGASTIGAIVNWFGGNMGQWEEKIFQLLKNNKKAYAEYGGVFGVEAEANAPVVVGGKARYQYSRGWRAEKASLDSPQNQQDRNTSRSTSVHEFSGEVKLFKAWNSKFKYKVRNIFDPDKDAWWAYERGMEMDFIFSLKSIKANEIPSNLLTKIILSSGPVIFGVGKGFQTKADMENTDDDETQKATRVAGATFHTLSTGATAFTQDLTSNNTSYQELGESLMENKRLYEYNGFDKSAAESGIRIYLKFKTKQEKFPKPGGEVELENEFAVGEFHKLAITNIANLGANIGLDTLNIKAEKTTKAYTVSKKNKFALEDVDNKVILGGMGIHGQQQVTTQEQDENGNRKKQRLRATNLDETSDGKNPKVKKGIRYPH